MPTPIMEFETETREGFSSWLLRVKPRLVVLADMIGRATITEVEKERQEDLTAHINDLLMNLSDIKLEVCELVARGREYYADWVAAASEEQLNMGWTKAKKTAQDFVVKLNCPEKRILDRLEAMNTTIEYRTITAQSMLRSLRQ